MRRKSTWLTGRRTGSRWSSLAMVRSWWPSTSRVEQRVQPGLGGEDPAQLGHARRWRADPCRARRRRRARCPAARRRRAGRLPVGRPGSAVRITSMCGRGLLRGTRTNGEPGHRPGCPSRNRAGPGPLRPGSRRRRSRLTDVSSNTASMASAMIPATDSTSILSICFSGGSGKRVGDHDLGDRPSSSAGRWPGPRTRRGWPPRRPRWPRAR